MARWQPRQTCEAGPFVQPPTVACERLDREKVANGLGGGADVVHELKLVEANVVTDPRALEGDDIPRRVLPRESTEDTTESAGTNIAVTVA